MNMQSLPWLAPDVRTHLEAAVSAVKAAIGDELVAIELVGSMAKPGAGGRGNPALIAIVEQVALDGLEGIANTMRTVVGRGRTSLRLLTRVEIERSTDTHAAELAMWQRHHVLLHGHDVLARLEIAPEHLRQDVERLLRNAERRIRNLVFHAHLNGNLDFGEIGREAFDRLSTAAEIILLLRGGKIPEGEVDMIQLVTSDAASAGVEPLLGALKAKRKVTLLEITPLFELVCAMREQADRLEVDQ